jgi:cell division septation protein DedD
MRDAHRMKEKLELSLDNRQVVSVLIGGIVVLGAVFVLGVVVGKKLSGTHSATHAPDLLSALDAQAQQMNEVRADPKLTFQEVLTSKVTVESVQPDAPPVKVVTVVAPAPQPEPEPKAEPAKVAETEPAAAEEPAQMDVQVAEIRVKPASVAAAAKELKVETHPEPAVVTARTAPKEVDLQKAIARASAKPTVMDSGAFTLQLSATQTRAEADKFVSKLRGQGYAPYIVEADVPGKGTWYRVRMGRFPTRDAAGRYLADFRRETRLDAFVASAN